MRVAAQLCLTFTPFLKRTGRADCHNCFVLRSTSLPKGVTPELCSHPWCCFPPHRRVLCQALACRWRGRITVRSCRPTAGSAPSRLDASPRSHCSWSSTNISQLHLAGPRNGLVGHRSWSSTNISQLHIHKSPERYRVCCAFDQHRTVVCLSHIPPSPKKKRNSASMSPDMPSLKKKKDHS